VLESGLLGLLLSKDGKNFLEGESRSLFSAVAPAWKTPRVLLGWGTWWSFRRVSLGLIFKG